MNFLSAHQSSSPITPATQSVTGPTDSRAFFKHALNPFHEIGGTCAASLCFASAEARMCQAASDLKND
jgi:hypothetical protein